MKIDTNWNEVTLKQYEDLLNYLSEASTEDEVARGIEICSILSDNPDKTREEILSLPINKIPEHLNKIQFITEPYSPKAPELEYTINGQKFTVQYNVKSMTAAQYIDFQNLYKNVNGNLKYIFLCFLIPKGKKYNDGYDVLKLADELYDKIPITVVMDIMFFFAQLLASLTDSILTYFIKKMKKMMKEEKDPVMKVKIGRSIVQLQEIQNLVKNEDESTELIKLVKRLGSIDTQSINSL